MQGARPEVAGLQGESCPLEFRLARPCRGCRGVQGCRHCLAGPWQARRRRALQGVAGGLQRGSRPARQILPCLELHACHARAGGCCARLSADASLARALAQADEAAWGAQVIRLRRGALSCLHACLCRERRRETERVAIWRGAEAGWSVALSRSQDLVRATPLAADGAGARRVVEPRERCVGQLPTAAGGR